MLEVICQMLLVITPDWDAKNGLLYLFERRQGEKWQMAGSAISINVGENGMGWGRGIHREVLKQGPLKIEGDRKAPAGIFSLGPVFGYAPELSFLKMPYLAIDPELECVDDPRSQYYNQFVKAKEVSNKDWNSSEVMLRDDDLYRYGIIVEHNCDPPTAPFGSCIFIHLHRNPGEGSYGCTTMSEEALFHILQWLDKRKNPHLVQLTAAAYEELKEKWQLPLLSFRKAFSQ